MAEMPVQRALVESYAVCPGRSPSGLILCIQVEAAHQVVALILVKVPECLGSWIVPWLFAASMSA
jgi:hypothetical protein